MLGASGLSAKWRPTAFLGVLATTTVLVTALPLLMPEVAPRGHFRAEVYVSAVIAELLAALFVASSPLKLHRRKDLILPAAALAIGVNFMALWWAMNSSTFLLIAIAMCLISAGALFVPDREAATNPRRLVVGFGCAAVLWANAGATMV
jgi:hypothetical protein